MKIRPGAAWRIIPTLVLVLAAAVGARGQGPTLPSVTPILPGSERSGMGQLPGAMGGGSTLGYAPGSSEEILGGRPGPSVPRVPPAITRPGQSPVGVPEQERITAPPSLPLTEVPLFGTLALPSGPEDEGPPDGLTLDMCIERLVRENLALRSRFYEIPQADADVLTAGLRANPLIYFDSQLIPYGAYTAQRPGGQLQYDLSVTYPLDVTRKRQARTRVACAARRTLEVQYQDAVRLQIDNLYTAYTDVLSARETIRFAEASRAGLARLLDSTRRKQQQGVRTIAEVSRIEALHEAAQIELMDAEETLRTTKRNLGVLLNMPQPQAEALQLRATVHDTAPAPPPIDALIGMALASRPDLNAYRLGLGRAEAEVRLARANRYSDVYLLYQPYTFQNNAPINKKSPTSWALGVTAPLPIYNRNQGNILKAQHNVTQSQVELTEREQQVMSEVRQAEREYALTRTAVQRIEHNLLPAATQVLQHAYGLYAQGEEEMMVYLNARNEFNDAARQYRDMMVRHRRSMLRLNTAVGQRILP